MKNLFNGSSQSPLILCLCILSLSFGVHDLSVAQDSRIHKGAPKNELRGILKKQGCRADSKESPKKKVRFQEPLETPFPHASKIPMAEITWVKKSWDQTFLESIKDTCKTLYTDIIYMWNRLLGKKIEYKDVRTIQDARQLVQDELAQDPNFRNKLYNALKKNIPHHFQYRLHKSTRL